MTEENRINAPISQTAAVQNTKPESAGPMAIVSLVLGIISIPMLCCCFYISPPLSIAALITGLMERKNIKEGKSSVKGQGLATAGWIMGIVALALAIILIVIWIVFVILGITMPMMDPNRFSNI